MTDFLSQVSLFHLVSQEHIDQLYAISQTRYLSKGEVIFERGQLAESLYVLQSGRVKLYNFRKGTGKEEIVCLMKPGQVFCLAPVLSRERLHIHAKTLEESQVLEISKDALSHLIEESHPFARNVISYLAEKECQMCEEVCSLSLSTTKERLAQFLLNEYRSHRRPDSFHLSINQSQLASHLGTVRETLSRDISALKKSGVIDVRQGIVTVNDETELSRLAGYDSLAILSDI